jgi:hypothetical protein
MKIGRLHEMKSLPLRTRNTVRSILTVENEVSLKLLNQLRQEKTVRELLHVERVLRYDLLNSKSIIPALFPRSPQTAENYDRLGKIAPAKEIETLDSLTKQFHGHLSLLLAAMRRIDAALIARDFRAGSSLVAQVYAEFGYSHFLVRKAALLYTQGAEISELPEIDSLLREAGLENKNIIMSSLIHCFKEEQDFLSLKRSIMNLPQRGAANKYTRDMCRMPFHPFAKNASDFGDLLQSWRQSSLIDAVIGAKVNSHLVQFSLGQNSNLQALFALIDSNEIAVNDIASMYNLQDPDSETTFYKQSSAWLENAGIVKYRTLIDHFYDFPESEYFELSVDLISRISEWTNPMDLGHLAIATELSHGAPANLRELENIGTVTRSAIFNLSIFDLEGYAKISETDLLALMSRTRDLAKTVNHNFLSSMAKMSTSKLSRLILYFLIAKKSKNELDDHLLRRILQDIVLTQYNGKIVELFESLSIMSREVAEYAYEICTEDFIAKLFHIIKSSSEITETRASLHKWMGVLTGEKVYIDRARTLLIDHQLNKIRNEIDDNRIYVDAARFAEWINDEVGRDLNGILTSIEHKSGLLEAADPQLISIVELCYINFCSSKIFGIASYLGRRIRHGTFKGHLFSNVVSIERKNEYECILSDPIIAQKWARWKIDYEKIIDEIIINKLHIESPGKRDGLLKPNANTALKLETLSACARNIARDFAESNSSLGAVPIITEYCWRLAENDLKDINRYLKGKKSALTNSELLTDLKLCACGADASVARDFCRELIKLIDDKLLSMYNWFKKPANVSPQASLSLLYKAVVAEVRESFPEFDTNTDFDEASDITLVGGAYHVIYDSFYVIVYNAAKHGKAGEQLARNFEFDYDANSLQKLLKINITSIIKDNETEEYVSKRLLLDKEQDLDDAQVSEDRSGIRKLHFLEQWNRDFSIGDIFCRNRKVTVNLTHTLEH